MKNENWNPKTESRNLNPETSTSKHEGAFGAGGGNVSTLNPTPQTLNPKPSSTGGGS